MANGTSMPITRRNDCQGSQGMLHKLFSFTTALLHDWKMYGAKKENGDTEIPLTHKHFEPIVFDRVLRFDRNSPKEFESGRAHTATLEGRILNEMLHHRYSQVLWCKCYRSGNKVFKLLFGEDQTENNFQKE